MLKQVSTAVAIACILACGGSGGGGYATGPTAPPPTGNTPPPASNGISVTNDAYTPNSMTVAVGSTVNWTWNTCTGDVYSGQSCVAHSVTFDDGPTSDTQEKGTFTRSFAAAGTYTYHCAVHGAAMTGKIVVN
jgi:plastocyanin